MFLSLSGDYQEDECEDNAGEKSGRNIKWQGRPETSNGNGGFLKEGREVGSIKQNEHNSDTFHLDSSVNLL